MPTKMVWVLKKHNTGGDDENIIDRGYRFFRELLIKSTHKKGHEPSIIKRNFSEKQFLQWLKPCYQKISEEYKR
jgi:hypothetical protein